MIATIVANGKAHEIHVGKNNSNDDFFVDFSVVYLDNGKRISITVHPKTDLIIEHIQLDMELVYTDETCILANAYHSGLHSRWYFGGEIMPLDRNRPNSFGGSAAEKEIARQQNTNHVSSWSYTYITRPDGNMHFLGSLKEWTGYTVFEHDRDLNRLTVSKDCKGLHLSHSYPALDIFVTDGNGAIVFDRYLKQLKIRPRTKPNMVGWSNERLIEEEGSQTNLINETIKSIEANRFPLDYIVISEDWAVNIGDWYHRKDKFPKGMAAIAAKIKKADMKAGIALSPFVVSEKSDIFAKHPDWLLKNDKGEVLIVERDPKQGLKLFALNILHPEVRDYLTGIFHTIVRQWGFDMIKLSCLYFAAAKTPPDKTRGQIMFETIQFVRNAVGLDTHLVVTEVPIASVFGIAETCQTTAKISPKWGLPWQKKRQLLTDYQLVTKVWLFRIALPKRVFLSDTQTAFFDERYLKLNKQQQRTLLFLNALCNNSLTLSDSLVALTEAQVEDTRQAIFLINAQIIGLSEILLNVYEIIVKQHEKNYYCFMNLTGYELAIRGPKPCSLAPFETKIVPV